MNHPIEMYNYHTWANQTILGRIKELPSSVLSQEVNSSFPTIAHALSHIYAVDKMWYLVLTGNGMQEALQACIPLNESILSSVDEYAHNFAELAEQYREWFRSQTDLEQTILLDNPFANIRQTRLSEIVLHVVNHGTYHRGNVSTMLRQLGHASTMNDYSLFWYQESVESI
ncbi:DinB family protein [Bacillus pseudomycoides]|uniref:Damage-inducible protein DinB n=1 Tax=Bacillus pseudomycoides TaxID=64104 RepID=A0ABD6T063_9BACI|nr:DinB family protein [Bacillus pseudomycoides]PEP71362.1 damage-inducible protein DinB [Bacillus pseudomycoides]PFW88089.1 damage-inducible protein DinB [Bacillus pseudomycoides]PFX42760.1 damage-inducible protein DinB [Bacillus pseudomycoides]PGF06225.1 damage-inducible protein DinB [Bacillus pseudomycoides]PHE85165.1 damage-inducible protein DinB [Bacillus pseudomycoides]